MVVSGRQVSQIVSPVVVVVVVVAVAKT